VGALVRGGRLLLTGAALALTGAVLAACRAQAGPPVGVSSPRADAPVRAVVDAGAPGVPSPVPADFRQRMTRVAERALSRGHGEAFDAVVWADEAGRAAWGTSGEMPDGVTLVEEAIERGPKGDRAAGLLVMEKRGGTWRFVAVDKGGRVVEEARVAACIECHKEAPRDFVFRAGAPPPGQR
jgi:hypothetical protein